MRIFKVKLWPLFMQTLCFISSLGIMLGHLQVASAGVLMQGFYWDAPSDHNKYWWDRLAEESSSLSESGFTAVWIPPVLKGASGGFSNGYDPFDDYDIGSKDQMSTIPTRWGTREQLTRSVAMMRANGLEVYVDMVLAHRNGDSGDKKFLYKDSAGMADGGRFPKGPDDFSGDSNGFGRKLDHTKPYVRDGLIKAGDWLMKTLGAQGIRIDVAKQIPPDFLTQYLSHGALTDKFVVSEYWDENTDILTDYINTKMNGRVTAFDFPLWGKLKAMSNGEGFFNMRELVNAGLAARVPTHAVTFVENHDTDKNYPTLSNKHLGYAYILTSAGYPSVFWKDYFEHGLKEIIDPLIWIHENLADGETEYLWADDDLLIYERQGKQGLLVGLNDNEKSERREQVQTRWEAGTKLHDYTGNQPEIVVEADGKALVTVGANSYVAYAPAGIEAQFPNEEYEVVQEFAGAADLDLPPATPGEYKTIGRIFVEANTEIQWELYLESTENESEPQGKVMAQIVAPDGAHLAESATGIKELAPSSGEKLISREKGWYEIRVKSEGENLDPSSQIPYWVKVKYKAPKTL